MSDKAWGGRFEEELNDVALRYSASVDVDSRLAPQDIRGSIAHVRMLAAQGIVPQADADAIVAGLERIAVEIQEGQFAWQSAREDVHMNIEATLSERIGAPGGKLHTGRSRNDQVATDMRLFTREACEATAARIDRFLAVLAVRASGTLDVLMPGYTHLQRAQPVRLAHHLLGVGREARPRPWPPAGLRAPPERVAAGQRRAGGHHLPARSRGHSTRARLHAAHAQQPRCGG